MKRAIISIVVVLALAGIFYSCQKKGCGCGAPVEVLQEIIPGDSSPAAEENSQEVISENKGETE